MKAFFVLVFSVRASVSVYFTWRMILEGRTKAAIAEKLRKTLFSLITSSWKYWRVLNVVNFLFVPLNYRVLYEIFVGFFWQMNLSLISSEGRRVSARVGAWGTIRIWSRLVVLMTARGAQTISVNVVDGIRQLLDHLRQ
jgi:Mpv17 / PMP22 family